MGLSYHVFVLSVGQNGLERKYIEDTGQTREEAEKTLSRSQRQRIIGYRLARPTSHYREQIAEREARGVDHDAIQAGIAAGRKRKVVYRDK